MIEKIQKKHTTGRLFLGIPLPSQTRKMLKIQSWPGIDRYKNNKLIPAYNWHFSLCFFGNVDREKLLELKTLLSNGNWGSSFKLGIKNFGGFPDMQKARIIWVGAEHGSDHLSKLTENLRNKINEKGIEFDQRPFVPHLTLCKLKFPKNISHLGQDFKMRKEILFPVNEFILYESTNTRNNPYVPLMSLKLSP